MREGWLWFLSHINLSLSRQDIFLYLFFAFSTSSSSSSSSSFHPSSRNQILFLEKFFALFVLASPAIAYLLLSLTSSYQFFFYFPLSLSRSFYPPFPSFCLLLRHQKSLSKESSGYFLRFLSIFSFCFLLFFLFSPIHHPCSHHFNPKAQLNPPQFHFQIFFFWAFFCFCFLIRVVPVSLFIFYFGSFGRPLLSFSRVPGVQSSSSMLCQTCCSTIMVRKT